MKIALLGGAFNPVHNGHLFLARQLQAAMPDFQIRFVPSHLSAHKPNQTLISSKARIEMLELALEGTPWAIERCEVERGGISYTAETVREMKRRYGDDTEVCILIGDDLVPGLPKWRDPDFLLSEAFFAVAAREKVQVQLPPGAVVLENSLMKVSSTEIRMKAAIGESLESLVPPAVAEYICEKGLYRLES